MPWRRSPWIQLLVELSCKMLLCGLQGTREGGLELCDWSLVGLGASCAAKELSAWQASEASLP
jgi:hypothetical protein